MPRPWIRAVSLVLAFTMALAPVAQAAVDAPLPGAPPAADPHKGIAGKVAAKLYKGLKAVITKTAERASRSDKVNLRMVFSIFDDEERMLFDLAGTVKVKVPTEKLRAKLQEQMDEGRTSVLSSNGPVSMDLAITPLRREGDVFVFGVQLDLMILTHQLFSELIRNAAQTAGMIGLSALAGQALDALASVDTNVAGRALELGVEELPTFLSGEAGAIAYTAFQTDSQKTWKEQLKGTISAKGLMKHFTLAAIFAGVTGGAKALGAGIGGAVAASLIPGGGPFLGTVLATGALVWFGNWAVTTVGIKLPALWKMAKIGRLYRKANDATGSKQERLARKFVEYKAKVTQRILDEMDKSYKRWTFLSMVIRYFRHRVKDERHKSRLDGFDLYPYQTLVDEVCKRLSFMARDQKNWYAARMFFQLKDSVNQLDELGPDAPDPRGVWKSQVEAALE